MHARKSKEEAEELNSSSGNSSGSNTEGPIELQAVEEDYEVLDSFITQLPIEQELTMEELSAFQTSVALEMAVANEIEDPAPWVDVSILGSTPLFPPPEDIHSSYIALPTGITSYVDLPFSFNVGLSDYIYPEEDVDALLGGTDSIGEIAATVNEHDAEDLIKELLNNSGSNMQSNAQMVEHQVQIMDNSAVNHVMTLKVVEGWD